MKKEIRVIQNSELRAVREGDKRIVEWTPIVRGVRSTGLYFVEILDEKAFDATDFTDVRGLWNHDSNMVMGRNKSTTLTHYWDGNKFRCRCELSSSFPEFQYEQMERGDVTGGSFGFTANYDDYEWEREGDIYVGRLMKVASVFEVSVVPFPAYNETDQSVSVGKRSLDEFQKRSSLPPKPSKEDLLLQLRLGLI